SDPGGDPREEPARGSSLGPLLRQRQRGDLVVTNRLHSLILTPVAFGPPPWLGRTLGALGLLALAAALTLALSSCSSGPQTAGTGAATSPSCAWNFTAGGESPPERAGAPAMFCLNCTIDRVDMSCLFDRTTSSPATNQRGVEVDDVRVDPRTSVSATGPQ